MESGRRLFEENGFTPEGKVLSFEKFKLNRDIENKRIVTELGDYLVSEAVKMLDEEIPLLPLSLYRDFFITGVRSRFEKVHHNRRKMLLYMTLAEDYERRGRFIAKISDVLWAILEESGWVIPAHFRHSVIDPDTTVPEVINEDDLPGLDLYSANCCATVALTVYLLSEELDKISPVICNKARALIYRRGVRPFTERFYGWAGEDGRKCNNWVTNITSSILFATAVTVKDAELRERVVRRAMRYLDNYSSCSSADGVCDEGPGYWSGAAGNFFDCLEMIDDMTGGEITVYNDPLVKAMGEYIASANIDGRYFLNFADARPMLEQPGKMITRYGKKCGSDALLSFGKMTAANNPINTYYFFGMIYRVYKDALSERDMCSGKVTARTSVWFPDCKIAIFRENEDTSKGFYLAVKGGHNKESHNHKDVGCFVVYYDGKPVIIDPSHGSYDNGFFGPMRYHRWFMKSSYHSIPSPNGLEEEAGSTAYASCDEVFSEKERSFFMELKNAFARDSGLVSMHRKCTLTDGGITVDDTVILKEEGEIRFNYLSLAEPRVISDGKLLIAEGRTFEYDTEGVELVIERVENKNLPYEDLNFKALWNTDAIWRITLVNRGKEKRVRIRIK